MVKASEMLGAAPVRVASFTTSMGFAFHHSPVEAQENITYYDQITRYYFKTRQQNS
jgi:hypothetical protein